jgi:hypothetical protein
MENQFQQLKDAMTSTSTAQIAKEVFLRGAVKRM